MFILEILAILAGGLAVLAGVTDGKMFRYVFNRFKRGANEAAEKVKDPLAETQAAIAEMEDNIKKLAKAKQDMLEQMSATKRKVAELTHEVNKWGEVAKAAGLARNEGDCKVALVNKQQAIQQLQIFEETLNQQQQIVDATTKKMDSLRQDITRVKGLGATVAAKTELAKLRAKAAENLQILGVDSKIVGELEAASHAADDKISAASAIEKDQTEGDLASKYNEGGGFDSAELDALMGRTEAPQETRQLEVAQQ